MAMGRSARELPKGAMIGNPLRVSDIISDLNTSATGTYCLSEPCVGTTRPAHRFYRPRGDTTMVSSRHSRCSPMVGLILVLGAFLVAARPLPAQVLLEQASLSGHHYELWGGSFCWTAAQSFCEARGGYLATVACGEEHAVLALLEVSTDPCGGDPNPAVWIGLTDQASEGNFLWVTGESVTYTNWDTGEPNNDPCCAPENYTNLSCPAHPRFPKWNDERNCGTVGVRGWFCEYGDEEPPRECAACPPASGIDYHSFTSADCAVPQNAVAVYSEAELEVYLADFGFDGTHVRDLNVRFNPTGDVVLVSPCSINLAGEGGFLDIEADNVCIYGRRGISVAEDQANPDAGITASSIVLVSEEGDAGFSKGLTLVADDIEVQALQETTIGLDSTVTVDGPLMLISTGNLPSSNAIVRQGSEVNAGEIHLIASRGASLGPSTVILSSGELHLTSTGSAVMSVASIEQGAQVLAGSLTQISGNKVVVGKNATVDVSTDYHMNAGGSCSITASAIITTGSTSGNCFE